MTDELKINEQNLAYRLGRMDERFNANDKDHCEIKTALGEIKTKLDEVCVDTAVLKKTATIYGAIGGTIMGVLAYFARAIFPFHVVK
jgi:transcription initiation factor TFIIIB Brf1 subunit/transcription initiation factor TFIIB